MLWLFSVPNSEADTTELIQNQGEYLRLWAQDDGLLTVALRYFRMYGPQMRPNMAISSFVSRCVNGEPPVIYPDGQQTCDFTFVADIVDANRTLLESDAADGDV